MLSGPRNWHEWLFFIRGDVAHHVWQYIDPDLPEQPVLPERPRKPQFPEERTPEAIEIYKLEKSDYNSDIKKHDELTKRLQEVKKAISTSINPDLHTHFYKLNSRTDTAYARLKVLKDNVAPTDEDRELMMTADYETLKRVQKRLSVELWLSKFRKVCNEATSLKLACVAGRRAQFDFLTAVRLWEKAWADIKLALFIGADPTPTLAELMESFVKIRRLTARTQTVNSSHVRHLSFGIGKKKRQRKF